MKTELIKGLCMDGLMFGEARCYSESRGADSVCGVDVMKGW